MAAPHLPSDFEQWRTATRYQLRFYLRTWRFIGWMILIVVVGGITLGITIYQNSNAGSAAAELYAGVGSFGIFGIILGAFMGGDALAMDFSGGTGFFMLVLPVRRTILLLGRYTAAFLATAALVVVFYVFSLVPALYFYGASLPWGTLGASFLLALLFEGGVLATAFFFSSLFRSSATSLITSILVLFLGFDIVDGIVGSTLGYEPWFSILYASNVIGSVLVNQPHYVSTTITLARRSITTVSWSPYLWEGIAILAGYVVVFLGLAIAIYSVKESKG